MNFIHPNPNAFDYPRRQYFSLPYGLINYIIQNPLSSVGLLKIQKTCKYFFAKKQIIVVHRYVEHASNYLYYHASPLNYILHGAKAKYWFNNGFQICGNYSDSLTQFIYRCSLKQLIIYARNFTLKQINFFLDGGKIKDFRLSEVDIHDDNGAFVTCDKILEKLPDINKFYYRRPNEIFTSETFQKMNQLKFQSKLKLFDIHGFMVSNEAYLSLLLKFIKKNLASESRLILGFQRPHNNISQKFVAILKEEDSQAWMNNNKIKVEIGIPGGNTYEYINLNP